MTIDQSVGLVAHLPLNAILKGERGVEFELVKVDLTYALDAAETLHLLTILDLSSSFATIAPAPSPSAGDAPTDAPHGTVVEHDAGGRGIISVNPTPASDLDTLRAEVRQWQPADRAALTAYFERNDTDTTDAEQVAEAMQAVRSFHDVAADLTERPVPDRPVRAPIRNTEPDEGDPLADIDVEAAGERYLKLPADVRSWVTVCGSKVRLSATHGGKATRRRFDILRGLCNLAEAGFDNDDMARAVMAHLIGEGDAWAPIPVADLIATLDAAEAVRFAAACDAVAGRADVSLRYTNDNRAHLEASVLAA